MRFSPLLTAASLAAAAPQHNHPQEPQSISKRATLPYYLEFHYTNNFVTVGDTDLFAAIWQKGYGSGDATGIATDDTYNQYGYSAACVWEDSSPDLSVQVKISGNWGVVSGVDGFAVRNQPVRAMWELVQKIQEDSGVIWKDCRGCGLGGCSDNPQAACGQFRPEMCACQKNNGGGGEAMDLCFGSSRNYKVPSEMTLTLYNSDGSLRADSLTVSVESAQIVPPAQKCGKLGAALEVAIGIIPEFGKFIADQVKIACRT
ncbi:hypothetical protein M409DRAFT_16883 [Zasmidium cellare ATCC 36951]|uniref:Uncharacterized protein n=1 Tax=Zasmidium cellare ATCC 36951 TaxID=1080233 RepID=A0A6A6D3F8_ZASCE|nr:uncharacterized protein M409DRAFT_16883 [Zasmidium cellare ATCC 36951]KAF2172930.1 hypothetical protein M409DRAFT_16883 [Zasmidium cellare ATCC 36951]